ncbi:DUF1285 domain-containing protein [Alcanivorax sp. 1008]|uniref:DUF1285 domain-containing protein n=1 Tax=Alcanivorax sp. 1008 TaxID=2816853 RepID=UPI001D219ABD|nr:DUF1285 domain-containing protein [Alcanivorax sp. 1008]MCC1497718.1 DUF1285 domain-containing protein [Alcanivorax sp. 1008]
MSSALDDLLARLAEAEQSPGGPPLEKWQPPLSGDIDIRIASDGRWYHEGTVFQRTALVKLFSSILRREGEDYVLVTPVEKWRIQVDDLPFIAHSVARLERDGISMLLVTTNVGEELVIGEAHPLEVQISADDEPRPAVEVRAGLWARVDRPSFYQLVDWAESCTENGRTELRVHSAGKIFTLGSI